MSISYRVKAGDSLWGIAQKNNTTVAEIRKLNKIKGDIIHIGDRITVPGPAAKKAVPAAKPAVAKPVKKIKTEPAAKKAVAKPVAKKATAKKTTTPVVSSTTPIEKGTVDAVLLTAWREVGYQEGPRDNETKFGKDLRNNFVAWCGVFTNWVCKQAGVKIPTTYYTPYGAAAFQKKKAWYTWKGGTVPQPGDILYFDFPSDGIERISHVGICVRTLPNGRVLTIEGNTGSSDPRNGGSVQLCSRNQACIVGWGRPKYKEAPLTVHIPNKPSQTWPR